MQAKGERKKMWLIRVQLNITMVLVIVINPLVSCTDTENTNNTRVICWTQTSNESHLLETRCNQCSQCPKGTYVVKTCTKSQDTVCQECPVGTYSAREDSASCLQCTDCAEYGKSNVVDCSRTEDTTCDCPEDSYLKNGRCVPCSKCPPGNQVSKTCGNNTDTECTTCRPGSFSNQENSKTYCQACHVCYRNRIEIQSCSPTTNTICGECKEEYYKEENTAHCAKCSYCYPEHPGYTFPVEECMGLMHDPNYTCMPVTVIPHDAIGNEIDVSSVSPKTSVLISSEQTTVIISSLIDIHASRTNVYVVIIVVAVIVILFVFLLTIYVAFMRYRMGNTNSGSRTKPNSKNILKVCCMLSTNRHQLIRQKSVESGDELDESNRPKMRPVSEERNRQTVESEVELDESNRPNMRPVSEERNRQTVESEVELDESNRHNMRPVSEERNTQTTETGVELDEPNRYNMRPVSEEHNMQTFESECENNLNSIESCDSGFSSIQGTIGPINELKRPSVIECGHGTRKFRTNDVIPDHLYSEPITESILNFNGKGANPEVFCI